MGTNSQLAVLPRLLVAFIRARIASLISQSQLGLFLSDLLRCRSFLTLDLAQGPSQATVQPLQVITAPCIAADVRPALQRTT